MAEGNRVVTVGVDTHKDAHVAAALDAYGTIDASPDGEAYHRERSPAPPADPLSSRPSVP